MANNTFAPRRSGPLAPDHEARIAAEMARVAQEEALLAIRKEQRNRAADIAAKVAAIVDKRDRQRQYYKKYSLTLKYSLKNRAKQLRLSMSIAVSRFEYARAELAIVTAQLEEERKNTPIRPSSSGERCVSVAGDKFRVTTSYKDKSFYLGTFGTIAEAVAARDAWEKENRK